MLRAIVLILALSPAALGAQDDYFARMTGNQLLEDCEQPETHLLSQGLCMAYIVGVADYYSFATRDGRTMACVPREAVNQQIIEITINYLRANPEIRHSAAAPLVFLALAAAYPCSSN